MYFQVQKNELTGYSPMAFRKKLFKVTIAQEKGTDEERIFAVLNSKNKNKFIEIVENGQSAKYTYKQIMEIY